MRDIFSDSTDAMKIAGLQWDIIWENRSENFQTVEGFAAQLVDAELIVLPEMFATGFSMDVDLVAESETAESESFLRNFAMKSGSATLGGLVRRGDGKKGRNELTAFDPNGQKLVDYRKNRTFRFTGESDHYENGTEVVTFDWGGGTICPLICYDLRFPELFRRGAAQGAELFVVIASWPTVRVEHWLALLRARAIENLAYVLGVNRTGSDPENEYPGRSVLFDHMGNLVADAGEEPGIVSGEVDWQAVRDWRKKFPALQDLSVS